MNLDEILIHNKFIYWDEYNKDKDFIEEYKKMGNYYCTK